MSNLSEKAMLVSLHISQWDARKYDGDASREVIRNHSASDDAGRFNKSLIARDAVKSYQKVANQARIYHYANTLPWGEDDSRILPSANYFAYTSKMREIRDAWRQSVRNFIDSYPALIEQARANLNGLFKQSDYPPADRIADRFDMSVSISPLPDSGDFRVALGEDEVQSIKADIEKQVQDNIAAAQRDIWERLVGAVKHAAETLKTKDKIFRDSLIGNLIELSDLLPRLNIGQDGNLTAVINDVKQTLCTYEPNSLRQSESLRDNAAKQAADILKKMENYY